MEDTEASWDMVMWPRRLRNGRSQYRTRGCKEVCNSKNVDDGGRPLSFHAVTEEYNVNVQGRKGCLGLSVTYERVVPTKLEVLEGRWVVLVAAGKSHSAAMTADGGLLAWGLEQVGQLGLGDKGWGRFPACFKGEQEFGGSKVVIVVCCGNLSIIVTYEGTLWSCGEGRHGALGLGDRENRLISTRVDAKHFASAKIVTVSAYQIISAAAVTKHGVFYS